MKFLIPLLIVSTSALAATTIQYAQRASSERKRADEALATTQKQEVRIRELQIARQELDQRLQETQRMQAAAQSAPAKSTSQNPWSRAAGTNAASPGIATFGVFSNMGGPQRAIAMAHPVPGGFFPGSPMSRASPAAQRYLRAQTRQNLHKQYADLGDALGLSQEQSNQMIDLLADQMNRSMTEPRQALTDMASIVKQSHDMKARNDAELAALIGQDKVRLWQDYQASMPQRSQVNWIGEQLGTMGMPLSEGQRAQLLNIMNTMREEQFNTPNPIVNQDLTQEERIEQSMKWQDESDQRLLERMKGVLTAEQYAHYSDFQAYQSEMRDAFRKFRPPLPAAGANGEIVESAGNGLVLRSYSESSAPK